MPLNDVLRQRTHALASSINSHRVFLYTLVSLVAVSAIIANALKNYSNFYSVAISLSKSSRSVLVLANFGFLLALLCGHIVQRIFFGSLRPNEVERLYDRLWFFITESLLAFTIFRDEFDIPFALMFGFLLFVKSFHWLASDRIEWMDQRPYPGPSLLFHFRMSVLFIILWTTDLFMFIIAVENTITNGVGGMVLFASEYGILMASVVNTISKYLLSTYELRRAGRRGGENAPPWEHKSMWVFYIELGTDFLKLTTYLVFFTIIITFYGLPLNIVRDVYITARSFIARLRALHRYQTATRNMDQRYPNATPDEMTSMSDRTCIICREEMVVHEAEPHTEQTPITQDGPNTTPKKLPCGHIFHFHCLRSWLERQQSCPTCRRTVLDTNPQAQAAGAVPVPPVAQAGGPQQQNPIGAPAAQNQNQQRINNPLGNPLGLLGRLFGPPAQLPIIPAQAQFPQNQNIPAQNPGNLAGQVPQGVVIQYHIQYQIPRNQNNVQQEGQHPPQPLQPVPHFPGFPGPGGAWQQWPGGAENHPDIIPAPPEHIREANGFANPIPSPTSPQQPSPQGPHTPTTPPTASTSADDSGPQTPRDAAALAALRRSNASGNNGMPPGSRPSNSPQSVSTETNPPTQTTIPDTNNPTSDVPRAPPLIPLYDYSAFSSTLPAATQANGIVQPLHLRPIANSRPPPVSTTPQNDNIRAHSRATLPQSRGQAFNPARHQGTNSRLPLSQLPPNLTDEQLAIMDRVTREAIDERLRVLEGVSGAVYRCIDDLMRMRSTLPVPTPTLSPHNPAAPGSNGHPTPPPTGSSSSNGSAINITDSSGLKGAEQDPTGSSSGEDLGKQEESSSHRSIDSDTE